MAKVGYIFKADRYDGFEADKEWMQKYGCVQVIEELVENEALRPRWKQLVANLERGDEIVVAKFSNALRGSRELSAFIELCRIKVVRRGGGIAVFVRTCHESATESEGPEKNDEGDG